LHKKPHTKKAKQLISESKKGKPRSKRTVEKVIKARLKPVEQLTLSGRIIKTFPSVKEAELKTGVNSSNIVKVCKKTLLSAGGFLWKYKSR
jgi:hypothetical protein